LLVHTGIGILWWLQSSGLDELEEILMLNGLQFFGQIIADARYVIAVRLDGVDVYVEADGQWDGTAGAQFPTVREAADWCAANGQSEVCIVSCLPEALVRGAYADRAGEWFGTSGSSVRPEYLANHYASKE
jgi:hypothetical protein